MDALLMGVIFAGLAMVAGAIAAWFAFRGDTFIRRSCQPRIADSWEGSGSYRRLSNAGGAAQRFVWVGMESTTVQLAANNVPQHVGEARFAPG
jgi:hypothetical protein